MNLLGFSLLHKEREGDVSWVLPGVVFADDLVLMAEDTDSVQGLLDICTAGMRRLVLHFNPQESATVCFSGPEPDTGVLSLGGSALPKQDSYCYFGVQLSSAADIYECHERHIREVAQRGRNVLCRRRL